MEIKTGAATMLSPISEKYLFNTNNLNVPVGDFGPTFTLALKKGFTSHLEMGYQFDYLGIKGESENKEGYNLNVLTQFFVHTFQMQYNFKEIEKIKPLFNYFLYFKLGGTFLKNNPLKIEEAPSGTTIQNSAQPQAFVYGLGGGVNYQLNDHFSLTGSMDINNTTNGVGKIIQFPNLFFSNHINYYTQLSFGLSWWFNLRPKVYKRNDSSSIWYDSSKGI
jgi:hypothetical protein